MKTEKEREGGETETTKDRDRWSNGKREREATSDRESCTHGKRERTKEKQKRINTNRLRTGIYFRSYFSS